MDAGLRTGFLRDNAHPCLLLLVLSLNDRIQVVKSFEQILSICGARHRREQ
jgi:hypothetical protein